MHIKDRLINISEEIILSDKQANTSIDLLISMYPVHFVIVANHVSLLLHSVAETSEHKTVAKWPLSLGQATTK